MTASRPEIPPTLVVDTHALLWHLIGDDQLSQAARATLQYVDAGQSVLVIPAVVLAELFLVVEKGRIALSPTMLTATVEAWQTADNVRLTSLTPERVIESIHLTAIPDIFDRLIVAETRALGVPLITRDSIIVDSQLVPTIW